MKKVLAKNLRNKEFLNAIPNNMPGWYKWWATEESIELLLNSKYIDKKYLTQILPYLTSEKFNGVKYYSIYVGIAVKGSIRSRLNWHINQHHTKSSVESGFLSTFRKSISSLVSGNQYDEVATNNTIDKFLIEYHTIDLKSKSPEAKEKIEKIEKEEIQNHVLPINIKDNKNVIVKDFIKELKTVRKRAKIKETNKNVL